MIFAVHFLFSGSLKTKFAPFLLKNPQILSNFSALHFSGSLKTSKIVKIFKARSF